MNAERRTGELIGYARISTEDQNLTLQIDALKKAGCSRVFTDKVSGAQSQRNGFEKCFQSLKSGDQLLVWRLDRLGRPMAHLVSVISDLRERKLPILDGWGHRHDNSFR